MGVIKVSFILLLLLLVVVVVVDFLIYLLMQLMHLFSVDLKSMQHLQRNDARVRLTSTSQ